MQLTIKTKLSARNIIETTLEGDDLQDLIRMGGALLDFGGQCGLCESQNVMLQTRVTKEKGYKYTEFVCFDCRGKQQWGQYRDGKGYFLKDWEKFEPKQKQESAQVDPKYGKLEPDDDVPF